MGTGRIDYWYDVTGLTLQTGATNATFLRDQSGSVRSITSGGATHNYGKDRLGSVTAMVATDGTVARTYSYDPWGETIGITGTAYNPFLFTGTYKDGATGLYQMGARYYQPASGRFTQQDPLPDSILSFNRYAYADCNPSNVTDPTGLVSDSCLVAIAGVVFGVLEDAAPLFLILGPQAVLAAKLIGYFGGLALSWTGFIYTARSNPTFLDSSVALVSFLFAFLPLPFPFSSLTSSVSAAYTCARSEGLI